MSSTGLQFAAPPAIDFRPASLAKRETAIWTGLSGEVARLIRQAPFETEYCGPYHLLIAYEQAARHDGESRLEGLPSSTLHDLTQKLTFVPAGCRFEEWQDPRILTRATYLYIDPRGAAVEPDGDFTAADFAPRLLFDSLALWNTVLKFKALIEARPSADRLYADALGVVLVHELLRLDRGALTIEPPARGGLAGWQRRAVARHIEENLEEPIPLATLAALAQLSPYHFSRAFKQSFGMPPHRYHLSRRIERAKTLLAQPGRSVTEIGLELGFSEPSAFATTFRKTAGRTPTEYRRSLV